jgi:signal transduction histidine kinase
MQRTLTQKLLLGALICLVVLIGGVVYFSRDVIGFRASVIYLIRAETERDDLSRHFNTDLSHTFLQASQFVLTHAAADLAAARSSLDQAAASVNTLDALAAAEAAQGRFAPAIQQRNSDLQQRRRDLVRATAAALNAIEGTPRDEVPTLGDLFNGLNRLEGEQQRLNEAVEAAHSQDVGAVYDTIEQLAQQTLWSIVIAFSLFIGVLVLLLVQLRQKIAIPIRQLSVAAGVVAQGNLDQATPVTNTDEIGELQRAFNTMLASLRGRQLAEQQRAAAEQARLAAEQANRAKSAFLANVSHELRTPLTAIIGYSELLQATAIESSQHEIISDVEKIHQAGRHLLALINDVLDFSKLEAGKLRLVAADFSLRELIEDVALTSQPLVEKNHNRLVLEYPSDLGSLHTDPTKVRQILLNLLSNAAKFTNQGTITLRAAHVDGLARFEVADTGIGISPEQLGRLFQPFTQAADTTTQLYGGTGLGLALSRHLCQLMHGEIGVSSALGQGATFTVVLPARLPAAGDGDVELAKNGLSHV